MELRNIQSFIKVAQLLSFSKAAKELGYSQAAVTIQIGVLEKELHTRLFERFGKHIALTEKGALFLVHANEIIKACDNAVHALEDAPLLDGILRIGTIESLCTSHFPTLMETFHCTYPNVRVSIEISSPEILLDMLNHNIIDIVYFTDEKKNGYHWKKIFELPEEIVFIASPNNPIVHHKDLQLEDILKQPLLLTEKDASYRHELEEDVKSKNLHLSPILEIENTDFLIHRVVENLGVSFLPAYSVQSFVQNGTLCILNPKNFKICSWRQAIYHKNKWITPELQVFIQMIESEMNQ